MWLSRFFKDIAVRIGGKRIFLLLSAALALIITLSLILPSFQEIEASDLKEEDNFLTLESQEKEIVAPTPFIIPLYYKTPQNLFLNETEPTFMRLFQTILG